MANTNVLTTIQIKGKTAWTATPMDAPGREPVLLLQDTDGNAGIIGTADDLCDMLAGISDAMNGVTANGK